MDETYSEKESQLIGFTRCALSGDILEPPIMADKSGRLYRKEAILQGLVDKTIPKEFNIKKLKDVKQIVPNLSGEPTPFPLWDPETSRLQCPISGMQCPGSSKYWLAWGCGCLFSERALSEIGRDVCPVCSVSTMDMLVELVPASQKKN